MRTKKTQTKSHACIQCGYDLGHQCGSRYCLNCEPELKPLQAEIVPWSIPKGTVEERIAEFMAKHSKVSYGEAETYLILQAAGEVSAVFSSSDGGGRFGNFTAKLRREGKL